jgi:hypothetical protein
MKETDTVRCVMDSDREREISIERWAYDLVRMAVLQAVPANEQGVPIDDLPDRVSEYLSPDDLVRLGAWRWYVTAVRLTMQDSGELVLVPGSSPERIRRPEQAPAD